MDRCKTCAHWKPYLTGEEWGVRSFADAPAETRAAMMGRLSDDKYQHSDLPSDWYDWGDCQLTEMDGDSYERRPIERRAIAIDGSHYYAILRCAADFGCVCHKEWTGGL